MPRNPTRAGGGSHTNLNGLHFEQTMKNSRQFYTFRSFSYFKNPKNCYIYAARTTLATIPDMVATIHPASVYRLFFIPAVTK